MKIRDVGVESANMDVNPIVEICRLPESTVAD
jgi:hypothetical protein